MIATGTRLERATLTTSRLLDFCSERELVAQTGHPVEDWPLVALKELLDNALDACDEARVNPEIEVIVGKDGISISDNGPGIPARTVEGVLDFSVRVSNREAYMAPDRGAQGNALKTLVAMPFVLSEDSGLAGGVTITAQGVRHSITVTVDQLRQKPVARHECSEIVRNGTLFHFAWPDSASSFLQDAKARFLQMAEDYTFLNPHLTLDMDWFGARRRIAATSSDWAKWRPSDPTSAHWYEVDHLARLAAGYIVHDQDQGRDRTVREFVSEFRGLSSTAKQKKVLDATGFARAKLSEWLNGDGAVDREAVSALLGAMRLHSKPVAAPLLGVIGEEHLKQRFAGLGGKMESFNYRKVAKIGTDGLPVVIETAFAWLDGDGKRRLITGVNWSAGIGDPFRVLGATGEGLSSILTDRRAGPNEPIAFLLHVACPRVEYTDRGKSAIVVKD